MKSTLSTVNGPLQAVPVTTALFILLEVVFGGAEYLVKRRTNYYAGRDRRRAIIELGMKVFVRTSHQEIAHLNLDGRMTDGKLRSRTSLSVTNASPVLSSGRTR